MIFSQGGSLGGGVSFMVGNQRIPSWNSTGRPKNPKLATFGYNFETKNLEYWTGLTWLKLPMKKINI